MKEFEFYGIDHSESYQILIYTNKLGYDNTTAKSHLLLGHNLDKHFSR